MSILSKEWCSAIAQFDEGDYITGGGFLLVKSESGLVWQRKKLCKDICKGIRSKICRKMYHPHSFRPSAHRILF